MFLRLFYKCPVLFVTKMIRKKTSGAQNRKKAQERFTKEEELKKKIPKIYNYFSSKTDTVSKLFNA